jgi:hypothetical protein
LETSIRILLSEPGHVKELHLLIDEADLLGFGDTPFPGLGWQMNVPDDRAVGAGESWVVVGG